MAEIYPAESATNDPLVGGFVARFPSGATKSVAWQSQAPISDTLEAAKQYTTHLLDAMLKDRLIDDCERTNWASFAAAVQKVIMDWNEKRRAALYAAGPGGSDARTH